MSEIKNRTLHTEEWKQKNSERAKEWHENNVHPMQGKLHSKEIIAKIGESSKECWASGKHSQESIDQGAQKRKMKKEREQSIVKAYQNGDTIPQIKTNLNAQTSSIYRVLKRNNIKLRQNKEDIK